MTNNANVDHLLDCLKDRNAELAAAKRRIAGLERCLGGPDIAECILQNREDARRKVAEEIAVLVEEADVIECGTGPYNRQDDGMRTLANAAKAIRSKYLQDKASTWRRAMKIADLDVETRGLIIRAHVATAFPGESNFADLREAVRRWDATHGLERGANPLLALFGTPPESETDDAGGVPPHIRKRIDEYAAAHPEIGSGGGPDDFNED